MAPDHCDYSVRRSGKIGAQRAALIYREPLKKGYSSGSLVINEVGLGTSVNKGTRRDREWAQECTKKQQPLERLFLTCVTKPEVCYVGEAPR